MRANRERLLHKLPTVAACLRGIAGVHSDDLMSSTCSLGFKDVEELAPARVHDGLGKVMVLHQSGDLKVFHRDMVIGLCVLLGDFEMVIVALALDLQMRLGGALGGFAAAITALLAAAHRTLFASERSLRCPIIAWIVYGMPFGVGQEGLQPNVNADIGMLARTGKVFCWWFGLADEKGVPMPISPQDKMYRFRSALYRAMQLDFEEMPDLLGHDEMFLVLMQVHVFAILSQLDGMPVVRFRLRRCADKSGIYSRPRFIAGLAQRESA